MNIKWRENHRTNGKKRNTGKTQIAPNEIDIIKGNPNSTQLPPGNRGNR